MTKSKAIEILINQKQTLAETYHQTFSAWQGQTISFVKDFFGTDSPEYIAAIQFKYLRQIDYETVETNKDIITQYLDNCIYKIKISGLYKKPKKNILEGKSNSVVLCWSFPILFVVFVIGFICGANENPKSKFYNILKTKVEKAIK